ncbi:magnesium-translocating P-type ATPase [Mastigocladopsis repens]|uniref:magnesium-translocating P-type ATPase n=1 Tax=Mastigocladopsis repens TaxID=221287 RepID=UPI000301388F|nr:magnesium-translocating P-type ATPase [Mastigocladopsis repens]
MQVSLPSLFKLRQEKPQPLRPSMPVVQEANTELGKLLVFLNTSRKGLTEAEACHRLKQYGCNEVTYGKPAKWYFLLLNSFNNSLIYIFMGLAIVSYLTKNMEITIVLMLLVMVRGLLCFVQEYYSIQTEEKLKAMVSVTATVSRLDKRFNRERRKEIPIKDLVPGDIVHLSAGDMIPADVRLLFTKDLFVSQAVLLQEALSLKKHNTLGSVVEKMAISHSRNSRDPLDTSTVGFMGTSVVSGTAIAVIVATGKRTCLGWLAKNMASKQALTSFGKGVNGWNWRLIGLIAVMVSVVFLLNGIGKGNWAIATFLTPQILHMIVTVNLAQKALAMAKQKVIIKRLSAIQNLGAMNILCTDKTGILTQGKITLERYTDIHGQENEEPLKYGYLNTYYQTGLKNLLDVALLKHVEQKTTLKPAEEYCKVDEVPFDFVRHRMSVVLKYQQQHILICKGAVEEIARLCTHAKFNGQVVPMSESLNQEVLQVTRRLNEEGLRVIAVAYKEVSPPKDKYEIKDESNLILVGYLAFFDPPNDSAAEALATFQEHGVSVKVITGNNDIVTRKICKQVGLYVHHSVLGSEVERMSDEELADIVDTTTVFAKMSPMQKARVIGILKRKGHIVGYIGDSINDAVSLRNANIAISVDTGVDIARESSDIILLEKSLKVLEKGVIEGRRIFGRRYYSWRDSFLGSVE